MITSLIILNSKLLIIFVVIFYVFGGRLRKAWPPRISFGKPIWPIQHILSEKAKIRYAKIPDGEEKNELISGYVSRRLTMSRIVLALGSIWVEVLFNVELVTGYLIDPFHYIYSIYQKLSGN